MRRVARSSATEVRTVDSWTRQEAATLLTVSEKIAPTFAPALGFLFYTGARRGELLGLKWIDVDFDRYRIHIRRALVKREITTPKSGRSRYVSIRHRLRNCSWT